MVLDVVAIIVPAEGKEARLEEILKELTGNVEKHEPDVAKYSAYKTQNADGAIEYVFIERYVDKLIPGFAQLSKAQILNLLRDRYKDEPGLEAHMKTDHFQAAGKIFGEEGLLSKAPTIYKLSPVSGFDSR